MNLPKPVQDHPKTAQWVAFRNQRAEVRTGRVDLGQGMSAAMVRIAATELGLDADQIVLVSGDTALVPDEGSTVGSLSVQVGGMSLRHATSAAKWECLERASALLQTQADALGVDKGTILKDGLDTGLSYWTLTEQAALEGHIADYSRPLSPEDRGAPEGVSRRDDMLGRLRGEVYIHDMVFPDLLHGRIVHAPFAAEGLTNEDDAIADMAGPGVELFRDGLVIGVTGPSEHDVTKSATRLRERLNWTLTVLDDPEVGLQASDAAETTHADGELPATTAAAEVTLMRPCIAHASIGACCALARFGDGALQVWSHSQGVFALRESLAAVLGLSPAKITVRHVPGSGCYGHNGADDVALDAALLARANPERHVRVIWARSDEFQTGPLSPAMVTQAKGWLSPSGELAGMAVTTTGPGHSTRPLGAAGPNLQAASRLSTPTPIQDSKDPPHAVGGGSDRNATPLYAGPVQVAKRMITYTPYRPSALRGLGAQVNTAVIEGLMDELAQTASIDPITFRLANLQDPRARDVVERVGEMAQGLESVEGRARGLGFSRYKNSSGYFAVIVEVDIDESVRPTKVWAAADVGEVVDPSGSRNQIEGGILQSLSIALCEGVRFADGANATHSWEDYPILGFDMIPDVEIALADRPADPPLGCGEIATGPATAAVLNAVAQGIGVRPSSLPLSRENLARMLLA